MHKLLLFIYANGEGSYTKYYHLTEPISVARRPLGSNNLTPIKGELCECGLYFFPTPSNPQRKREFTLISRPWITTMATPRLPSSKRY